MKEKTVSNWLQRASDTKIVKQPEPQGSTQPQLNEIHDRELRTSMLELHNYLLTNVCYLKPPDL